MQEKTHWMRKASKAEETLSTEDGIPGRDLIPSVPEDLLNLSSTSVRNLPLPPFLLCFYELDFIFISR